MDKIVENIRRRPVAFYCISDGDKIDSSFIMNLKKKLVADN